MVLFTKENMDTDKPVPVVILPPVMFIGIPTSQLRTGSIQGSWEPEIPVAVITTVGMPVEDDFDYIGIKNRNVVIHMECGGEPSWLKSLGEVWPNQILYQWLYWITNPSSVEEVLYIYWLVVVFPSTKKNYGIPDPDIKLWYQAVKLLSNLLNNRCNLRRPLVFFPYHWLDGVK